MKRHKTMKLTLNKSTIRTLMDMTTVRGGLITTDETWLCKSIDPNQGACP